MLSPGLPALSCTPPRSRERRRNRMSAALHHGLAAGLLGWLLALPACSPGAAPSRTPPETTAERTDILPHGPRGRRAGLPVRCSGARAGGGNVQRPAREA